MLRTATQALPSFEPVTRTRRGGVAEPSKPRLSKGDAGMEILRTPYRRLVFLLAVLNL